MNLLVIGFDRSVADSQSASGRRHVFYFSGWNVRFLEIGAGAPVTSNIAPGMGVTCAGGRGPAGAVFRAVRALWRLVRERRRFDVVTAQDPFLAGALAYMAGAWTGAQLHIQDHSSVLSRRPYGVKEWIFHPFVLFLLRRAVRIRTVSKRGARGLIAQGIPEERIDVLPVASDLTRFFSITREPEANHVVCVSRLSREKGLDVLLRAFADLRSHFQNAKLTIVGEGPARDELERLRSELGLTSSVEFVGHADPSDYYRRAALYVQPSRFEGWGIAVTEAAAVGLPIVMTDVGCAGEVIHDGRSGLVIPVSDARKLAQAMEELLKDPKRAEQLGRAAQASARALPSAETRRGAVRASLEETKSARRPATGLARILMVAIVARLGVWAALYLTQGVDGLTLSDSKHYLGLAESLLAGEGFTLDGGAFAYRTIGYPAIVAAGLAIFKTVPLFAFAQSIIGAFIAVQTFWLARELGATSRAARLAAWVVALEPHLVYYSALVMTEAPFALVFLGTLTAGVRALRSRSMLMTAWSGILFGLTLLIKPLLQIFPVFILFAGTIMALRTPTMRGRIIQGVCAFGFAAAVVTMPWLVWYKAHFGMWSFSNQGQIAAAQYLVPSLVSMRDGISYQEAERLTSIELESRFGPHTLSGKDLGPHYFAYAKEVVLVNPGLFMKSAVIGNVAFWTSHNYAYIPYRYHLIPDIDRTVLPPTHLLAQGKYGEFVSSAAKIFLQPFYFLGAAGRAIWAVVSLAFFVSLIIHVVKDRERRVMHALVLMLAVYTSLVILANGLGVEGRLRYHLMPVMFIYVALLLQSRSKHRT